MSTYLAGAAPGLVLNKKWRVARLALYQVMICNPIDPSVNPDVSAMIKLFEMAMVDAHRPIRGRAGTVQSECAVARRCYPATASVESKPGHSE